MRFENKNTCISIPWFAWIPTNVELQGETYDKVLWFECYTKEYWYNPYRSLFTLYRNPNGFRKKYKKEK